MRSLVACLVVALLCSACGAGTLSADEMAAPTVGACRNLTSAETIGLANDSHRVSCTAPHDAETFASGTLPSSYRGKGYHDPALDRWAYATCSAKLASWLGGDDSMVMRSVLTWIWFRPSQSAWKKGARWYRCDVLGGSAGATRLIDLPTTTKGLLGGASDDRWMVCARGATVDQGVRVACTQPHDWRAVTTIKLGESTDSYPGDVAVQAKTKNYCQGSVSAWLGYPSDYDYGYTWFGQNEWAAGNRRAVCWAKTAQ